jgi:anti-sigma B factor antagonist
LIITVRNENDVAIIDLDGDLMPGYGSEELVDKVAALLKDGNRNFLLNLERVDLIDSSGIGVLVRSYTSIRRSGGQLKLLKLSSFVRRVFSITGLITVFDVFDDEGSALSSF